MGATGESIPRDPDEETEREEVQEEKEADEAKTAPVGEGTTAEAPQDAAHLLALLPEHPDRRHEEHPTPPATSPELEPSATEDPHPLPGPPTQEPHPPHDDHPNTHAVPLAPPVVTIREKPPPVPPAPHAVERGERRPVLRYLPPPPPPPPPQPRMRVETPAFGVADEELESILSGLKTTIKIVGLGGCGSNTISRLVESNVSGADLFAANTDAQHLLKIRSPHKILLGRRLTRGLGAGAIPQVGEEAAREAEETLKSAMRGADMVFVTCGLGGGTGTGSAAYVASLAKEMGCLTIAICTWPFRAEGAVRWENADYGLEKLRAHADTVVVIPNDKLIELVPRLSLDAAFKVADDVLMRSIKGITEIITKPGLVNLDFNDIRTIMRGGGVAMIGLGEAESENRADEAVEEAISSPLIDVEISGATGALINVTGGPDMTVAEAERVAEIVQARINPNARIIWGAAIEAALEHRIRVMLVLTGVKSKNIFGPDEPVRLREDGLDSVR